MSNRKGWITIAAGLVCWLVIAWCSTSIRGGQGNRIIPEITLPEFKSDSERAIDAYERMMERYMDLTENNLKDIDSDVGVLGVKLDAISEKLSSLSTKIERIEKALDIEQPKKQNKKKR